MSQWSRLSLLPKSFGRRRMPSDDEYSRIARMYQTIRLKTKRKSCGRCADIDFQELKKGKKRKRMLNATRLSIGAEMQNASEPQCQGVYLNGVVTDILVDSLLKRLKDQRFSPPMFLERWHACISRIALSELSIAKLILIRFLTHWRYLGQITYELLLPS